MGRVEGGVPSSPNPCKLRCKQHLLGKISTGASAVRFITFISFKGKHVFNINCLYSIWSVMEVAFCGLSKAMHSKYNVKYYLSLIYFLLLPCHLFTSYACLQIWCKFTLGYRYRWRKAVYKASYILGIPIYIN